MKMSFAGKVVIVTGASSGIGAAIAIKFAAEGANVALVGRNQAKLKSVFEKCGQKGSKHIIITADVTKDEDATRIVSETIKHYGKLNVLVNNAGIARMASILDPNMMKTFDTMINTNLRSVAKITNLAASHLVETKGNIINISSIASMYPMLQCSSYGVSKAGLNHFTRCVALELASAGVRVNSINPGPVKTDAYKNMGFSEAQDQVFWDNMKKHTALGRISDSEEIADLTLFLASDKANGITGSIYVVDNGALLSTGPPLFKELMSS